MATTETVKNLKIASYKDLGLYYSGNQAGNSSSPHTQLDVPALNDVAFDNEKFRWWWVVRDDDTDEWRLIKTTTILSDDKINVTRGFDAQVADGQLLHFVLILSWDEMLTAIKNGLSDKYYPSRASISLTADQKEYNITTSASWIRTWSQIMDVRVRDVGDGATKPIEVAQPAFHARDDDGEALLILPEGISDVTNKTLEIQARRYYDVSSLADASTVTLVSERLLRAAIKYEALKMIFNKMGPAAKRIFGQMQVLVEKELAEEEARWQKNDVKRDWHTTGMRQSFNADMVIGWSW